MNAEAETAAQKFLSGYNCAQAVLYACCEDIGLSKNTALKIASGFGAGMGRNQEVCGAVAGAIMALSVKHGREENEEYTATEKTYEKIRDIMGKFQVQHGSYLCRELLNGCNLQTEEGQKYFRENNLKNTVCKECVRSAVQIVKEIL